MLNQEEVVYLSVDTIITMETYIFSTAGGRSEVELLTIVLCVCVCVCRKRQRECTCVFLPFVSLENRETDSSANRRTSGPISPPPPPPPPSVLASLPPLSIPPPFLSLSVPSLRPSLGAINHRRGDGGQAVGGRADGRWLFIAGALASP